ncbi:T9SS type A sorting domain-containing protein [Hymenobacter sp. BT18]|uniref:right-handed parallel beta-helix repeat-containing protein n=1 Tax=Hymenobacter sp. BT18 TaxID=2835648 RepID=UPI00143E1C00|nr:right-handed parallel beta-helix repeat-containing protein [Hymenobacter sp. BT18]QIX61347.1 T9SS type A sorting domain-containing protein [Hymenobacter sp. BT18]
MKTLLRLWLLLLAAVPLGAKAQTGFGEETIAPMPNAPRLPKKATAPLTRQQVAAACLATTNLDFGARTDNEDWQNRPAFIVGGAPNNTTISTQGTYQEPSADETSLYIKPAATAPTAIPKSLFWYTDYLTNTNSTTEITFNFNRPVNNFSLTIDDIDRNNSNYIDAVTFLATQADGTVLSLNSTADATVALTNAAYTSRTDNTITALQQNVDGQTNGTASVTFNKPIVKLRIIYQNTIPASVGLPGVQYIALRSMTWCTQANVATTLSGPANARTGTTVTYTATTTASGDYAATGVQPKVQFTPGLALSTFPAGSTYVQATGVLTLPLINTLAVGATSTSTITFVMPNSTVNGTASSTISTDDADPLDNNGTAAAAKVTTITNTPPVPVNLSSSARRNVKTALFPLSATDVDNDAITFYTLTQASLTSLNARGTLYVNNTVVNSTNFPNLRLTAAEAAALFFQPTTTATLGNIAFNYTATDAAGNVSTSNGTYTINITSSAPPVANDVTTTSMSSAAAATSISALSATDDVAVISYQISTLPSTGTLFYNTGTNGTSGTYQAVTAANLQGGTSQLNLTTAQAGTLRYDPSGTVTGNVTFTFTATDAEGGYDLTPATYTIPLTNTAPTAIGGTNNTIALTAPSTLFAFNRPSLQGSDPDGTIASYTITSGLPTSAQGTLYYSLDENNYTAITTSTVIPAGAFLYLYTGTSVAGDFTLNLQFRATDNSGTVSSNTATYTVPTVVRPVAANVTNASILSSANRTNIAAVSATVVTGSSIYSYIFSTVPDPATQGTLYYLVNGTPTAITAGQEITAAALGTLSFDPIGTNTNTVTFTYTARANSATGSTDLSPATYTIPITNVAPVAANVTSSPAVARGSVQAAISALSATDADGTIASFQLSSLPTSGTLFYNNNADGSSGSYVAVTAAMLNGGGSQLNLTAAQAASLRFTPAAGSTLASVTFTYTATDNSGTQDATPATFTIPLSNVAPETANVTAPSMPSSNGPTSIPAFSGSDADGTVTGFRVTSLPSTTTVGTLSIFDGTTRTTVTSNTIVTLAQASQLQFDPSGAGNGTFTFSVAAIDNDGSQDATPATYTLVLTNTAPVATNTVNTATIASSAGATNLDTPIATDPDGTISTYTLSNIPASTLGTLSYLPAGGTRTPISATITISRTEAATLQFDPSGTSNAPVVFNFLATDNNGATSNTATFTINLGNTDPVAANVTSSPAVARGSVQAAISALSATDADGTIASFQLSSLPTSGTLFYNNNADGSSGSYVAVTAAMLNGGGSQLNLTAAQAASLRFTPAAGSTLASVTFTYTATDNSGTQDATPATFTIPLSNVAPETANVTAPSMPSSNGPTSIPAFSGSDADGTVTGFRVTSLPSTTTVGTLSIFDGTTRTTVTSNTIVTLAQASQLQFDPSGAGNGTFTFSVAAIDNDGSQDATPATYTLVLTNTAPVAVNTTHTPNINSTSTTQTLLDDLVATDADGTIASYQLYSLPTSGTLYYPANADGTGTRVAVTSAMLVGGGSQLNLSALQAGNLYFTPSGTTNTSATFTFGATDNQGLTSNTATYTIPFNNALPVATSYTMTTAILSTSGPTAIPTLAATDADGTIASYQLTSLPANGTLYYNNNVNGTSGTYVAIVAANLPGGTDPLSLTPAQAGTLKYDPTGNFPVTNNQIASDAFQFTATDNTGGVDATPATYNVRVQENDTEAVYSSPNTYAQAAVTAGSTVATVTDADGTITSAVLANSTTLPSFLTLQANGTVVINSNPVVLGTYTFSVTTTDQLGGETTSAVTVSITNAAPVAQNVTNTPDMLFSAAATSILPLQATDADGTIASYTLSNLPSAAQGVLYVGTKVVNTTNFPGLVLTPTEATQLQFDPTSGYAGIATFNYTAKDNDGTVSNTATYSIPVEAPNTINGFVFEDKNYGGGTGRSLTASNGAVRPGATVELYYANGNPVINSTTGKILSMATDNTGAYTFDNLPAGSYTVRVVNSTVTSSRSGAISSLIGVQTFVNGDGSKVGGTTPASVDGNANTGTQTLAQVGVTQSVTTVSVNNGAVLTSIDFGFNFDVVVNTNNAGQGSLRQFVTNSNALDNNNSNTSTTDDLNQVGQTAGIETSIFMIPVAQLTTTTGSSKAAFIQLTSALPSLDPRTAIDGSTQTTNIGNTNASVSSSSTGPEVIVSLNSVNGSVFSLNGADILINGMGILGANVSNANLASATNTTGSGVYINANSDRAVISNSTIYGNRRAGILVNGASNVQILNNIVQDNGATTTPTNANANGIALFGADQATLTGNLVSNNAGYGIQMGLNIATTPTLLPSNNTLTGNIISGNGAGAGTQRAGLALVANGTGNLLLQNTFSGNAGDGILATAGTTNRFSQNTFSGNTEQSIDLMNGTNSGSVTVNDDQDGDAGANNLLNFPVFTQATISNGKLQVTGFATAGATVELYLANPGTGETFGEGGTFLATFVEGSAQDPENRYGDYDNTQGKELRQQRFMFALDLSTVSASLRAAILANGARVTATATLAVQGTSEFAGNTIISNGPLPVELTRFEVAAVNQDAQLTWQTAIEKNNDHFAVERSFDGRSFEQIGQVQGNGTTTSVHTYAYTDTRIGQQHAGTVYYRLKQVDTDGKFRYTDTRTVSFAGRAVAGAVVLYPNPATTQSTLDLSILPSGAYQVTLVDMAGRIIRTVSMQGGLTSTLDVRDLAEGTYTVLVRGQQSTHNLKLVKRN